MAMAKSCRPAMGQTSSPPSTSPVNSSICTVDCPSNGGRYRNPQLCSSTSHHEFKTDLNGGWRRPAATLSPTTVPAYGTLNRGFPIHTRSWWSPPPHTSVLAPRPRAHATN
ncbi:hypothetical protein PAHAL_2G358000 [Panicum hallii]|uniref:Uncharacterized protein n=1 Tax=Panicum hallii TaxID=206008 RepID=A0A2S3H1V9_9POAL|nr:hypothetical protein PAHAL_2G358000 [Panicum hallii]